MKKIILSLLCLLVLSACADEPGRPTPIKLDYSNWGQIRLNAKDIKIVDRTTGTPHHLPYIDYQFKPSIADAAYTVAQDRLKMAGTSGQAVYIIKEASLTTQPLAMQQDFESMFKRQQANVYTARVEVELSLQKPDGSLTALSGAHAIRNVTVPEDPNPAEKYKIYTQMLNSLMRDLSQSLDQGIQEHMAAFIVP